MSETLPPYSQPNPARGWWPHSYRRTNERLPSYADSMGQMFQKSLRPAYLFTSLISSVAAAILCAIQWHFMINFSGRVKILSLISAFLFTACTALQLCAFLAGVFAHNSLLRQAGRAALVSAVLAFAAEVLSISNVYANQNEILSQCAANYTSFMSDGEDEDADSSFVDQNDAEDVCKYNWNEKAVWNIAWLILILIFGCLYIVLSRRFVRQIQHSVSQSEPAQCSAEANQAYFPPETQDTDAFPMRGLWRRNSQDTLDTDEAIIDAKTDPMSDVYGGRNDFQDTGRTSRQSSLDVMDHPIPLGSQSASRPFNNHSSPSIVPTTQSKRSNDP
ncbi:hypothetical protein MYAM1_003098 [Malassezia yamatoensis]|uniref:Uncharacterized protein n=1 Tax=Malassezia yamatoensis TaxID=253288 RepID=A0AAJ6CHX9_9BASI|nr:hypothetical protein MYAM1_003098 [Malassezia yamatoensis]